MEEMTIYSENEKSDSSTEKIVSAKLGEIEYKEEDVITLTTPLLGFPELYDFLLIYDDNSYPFLWFQSVENPSVCFVLVETNSIFQDYKPNIHKRELKLMAASSLEEIKIFSLVVVPSDPKDVTANLKAPLLVNLDRKLAKQIILEDDSYQVKTPLIESK